MLSFRPVRLLAALIVIAAVGHVVGLLGNEWFGWSRTSGVLRQFDLNDEANLASYFESFLLACSTLVAFGLTLVAQRTPNGQTVRWAVVTGLLGLMTLDEAAQLHDMATGPIRRGLDLDTGALFFAWVIPAVIGLAIAAAYLFPLFLTLPVRSRIRLVIAAAVYFGGSIVAEMVSGSIVAEGRQSGPYHTVTTVEEVLELVGGLLVLAALLELLERARPMFSLSLKRGAVHLAVAGPGLRDDEDDDDW